MRPMSLPEKWSRIQLSMRLWLFRAGRNRNDFCLGRGATCTHYEYDGDGQHRCRHGDGWAK